MKGAGFCLLNRALLNRGLGVCNRIFPNLFAISICNKQNLIALQFICNKPVIYWLMSDTDAHLPEKYAFLVSVSKKIISEKMKLVISHGKLS